jgi:hypothetical protein
LGGFSGYPLYLFIALSNLNYKSRSSSANVEDRMQVEVTWFQSNKKDAASIRAHCDKQSDPDKYEVFR